MPGQCTVASFAQVAITKLTTVDLKTTSVVNFVNELSTKKYIAVETKQQQKVEQVRCGGNINKVRAQVIGTPLTAVEAECKFKLFPQLKDAALPFACDYDPCVYPPERTFDYTILYNEMKYYVLYLTNR